MNIDCLRLRATVTLLALVVSASLVAGCTNSSSPTEPKPSFLPTPTPLPSSGNLAGISGTWTGTYVVYSTLVDEPHAGVRTFPASGTFEQSGSAIVGTLVTSTGDHTLWKASFKGSLTGNLLEGTLEGGGLSSRYAKGTLSGTTLGISVWDAEGRDRKGQINLHR